jgi:hypothetical protein
MRADPIALVPSAQPKLMIPRFNGLPATVTVPVTSTLPVGGAEPHPENSQLAQTAATPKTNRRHLSIRN